MIFVEFMSPVGHVALNSYLITHLMKPGDRLIMGESLIHEYLNFNPSSFGDLGNGIFGRFLNTFGGICKINKLQKREEDLVILSYDIAFVFLIKIFLKNYSRKKIYAFIHNAFPSTNIKNFLLSFVKKKVVFIAFTDEIANSMRQLGYKSVVINHPVLRSKVNESNAILEGIVSISNSYDGVVFCASGSSPKKEIEKFAKENVKYLIVAKNKFETSLANIVFVNDYSLYGNLIELSDYVYIYFPYSERVSGVFYDALAFNKKIILNEGAFGRYAVNLFPNNAAFSIDDFGVKKPNFDFEMHNNESISKMKYFIA